MGGDVIPKWATLRRPPADASFPEVDAYHREVAANLAALGVGNGDEFVLINAREFNRQEKIDPVDEKKLGPFARDSETSRKAALDAYPRQGSQRERILRAFAAQIPNEFGIRIGYTRDDLETILHLSGNTIRPRVQELIEGGFLVESDLTRRTRLGSQATVLALTKRGEEEVRLREAA